MSRKIVIRDCDDCPYQSHLGAFNNPSYIPYCTRTSETLGYTTVVGVRGRVSATYDKVIPITCPLEVDDV